jgi:hypothetical protein
LTGLAGLDIGKLAFASSKKRILKAISDRKS